MSSQPPSHRDRTSVEHLWLRFRAALMAYLRRRLPTEADAEDVLQEIFLHIHRTADRLDAVRNVEGWLFTIARRAVADFYRARGRTVPTTDDALDENETTATYAEDASEHLVPYTGTHDVHEEVLSWIVPMIDELPAKYGVPLRMADVEGRTQRQVADALGLSLSGAKSRVQRARGMLGTLLRACCAVELGGNGRVVAFRHLADDGHCALDRCA